jgi:hypothetical protein
MITAEKLATLTQFSAAALTRAIRDAGYKEDHFLSARFIGITNGGQFCYQTQYKDIDGDLALGKVFLTYNQSTGTVKVDY